MAAGEIGAVTVSTNMAGRGVDIRLGGVFIPFTLSQTSMLLKWIRQKPQGWVLKFIINTVGALISFIVAMMFFLTKFNQVWSVLIFLPLIILIFYRIRKHYDAVADQLRLTSCEPAIPIEGNVVILPVAGITHVVENSLIRYNARPMNLIIR